MEKKIKLYFTYDEEIGFGGIYDIVKNKEKFPKFMVFGEPTYNEILIGCKGLLECELYFKGIKAHSSNPDKGESANLHAINFLVFVILDIPDFCVCVSEMRFGAQHSSPSFL